MKKRICFVSNSSSSSFIINKKYLTEDQIYMIKHHIRIAEENGVCVHELDFPWDIRETENEISGMTFLDNFDMNDFLSEFVGVDMSKVEWRE